MLTHTIDRSIVLDLGATLFNNIDGSVNERGNYGAPDGSYYITERLLLYPRISKDDRIITEFNQVEHVLDKDTIENSVKAVIRNLATVNFITYNVQKKIFRTAVEDVVIEGYEKPELINKYLDVKACARLYINKTERRSVIVADQFALARFHAICSVFPAILPWYFEEERNHLTEDELRFLSSFTSDDSFDEFTAAQEKLIKNLDLKRYLITNAFTKFAIKQRQTRIREINKEIERARNSIDNILSDVCTYEAAIRRYTDELFGIENKPADDSYSEVMKFLDASKNIAFSSVNQDNSFTFYCYGILSNYPDGVAAMIANHNSVLYENYDGPSEKDRIALIKAIFVDEILNIRIGAYYALYPAQSTIRGQGGYYGPELRDTNCMPNPHIAHYSCLGGNGSAIASCVSKGDLIGALNQCAASAISVNIRETPTFRYFLMDLFSGSYKCIVAPDREEPMTPEEACAYLKEKQENKTE